MKILLVEDNTGDQELTKLALDKSGLKVELDIASDGVIALHYLRQKKPELILLDLSLPRPTDGGLGVLRSIRTTPAIKYIPVVVLTTSNQEKDIWAAYEHWVNAYLIKPFDIFEFESLVKILGDFWLKHNRRPYD